MTGRATRVEFEYRFWIICAIYFAGFGLSIFDQAQFIVALRQLIGPGIAARPAEAATFAQIIIGIGALLVFAAASLRTWGRHICKARLFMTHHNIPKRSWPMDHSATRETRFTSETYRWRQESACSPAAPAL